MTLLRAAHALSGVLPLLGQLQQLRVEAPFTSQPLERCSWPLVAVLACFVRVMVNAAGVAPGEGESGGFGAQNYADLAALCCNYMSSVSLKRYSIG